VALLEGVADFIDRVVLLAHLHDQIAGGAFPGLGLGAVAGGHKEDRLGFAAQVVHEHIKGIERVTEGAGDLLGGAARDQIGAQGLVLAVFGRVGPAEEAAELT
jgi:hypothetical protein